MVRSGIEKESLYLSTQLETTPQEIKELGKAIIISCFSNYMVDRSEEDWTKCFCSLDLHQVECDLFITNIIFYLGD